MKTRTLLLLALGCGLAIMLAGAVFFFQLANQDDIAPPVPVGRAVAVGDMTVTVERAVEADGALDVTVLIGGVADPEGADGFRLIASGRPVAPENASAAGRCSATEVTEQTCLLRFDVSGADGSSRVLFYDRGDAGVRWVLG
jgi:hypothetical protein